jgi:catechol 2,3-dioxygenase-like lactoylglutathione lyase family enzyme
MGGSPLATFLAAPLRVWTSVGRPSMAARERSGMTSIARLMVDDDPSVWRSAGFAVDSSGHCRIGTVELVIEAVGDATGITSWVLAAAPDETVNDVDGLSTAHGEPASVGGPVDHRNGAVSIDHVVVMTPDLDRTIAAVERGLGVPLKRIREAQAGDRDVRQAFFRMGEVILEVVWSGPHAEGRAKFWGLAVTVADLDATFDALGPDQMTVPKSAVQPGRRIARLHGPAVPVALMSA